MGSAHVFEKMATPSVSPSSFSPHTCPHQPPKTMPPKKEPPLEFPPLPTASWNAQELGGANLDLQNPKAVQFTIKPSGKIPPHPSIQRTDALPIEQQENGADSIEVKNVVFDSRSAALVMLSLKPVQTILSLTLFNAGLSPQACRILAEGLPLTSVVHLSLDYNDPFDENDESNQVFLRSLAAPTSRLITVSLRGNGIADAGVGLLCESLGNNSLLQSINLFDNRLSDVGSTKLAETIKAASNTTQLGSVSLANNRLESASAWADLFGSGRGQSMQLLNLSNNRITGESLQYLLTVLASNKARLQGLKSLALHCNNHSPAAAAQESVLAPLLKELQPIKCTV